MKQEWLSHHLLEIEGGKLLLVFHTSRYSYQFCIVTDLGEVMSNEDIYYTAVATLRERRKGLGVGDVNELS